MADQQYTESSAPADQQQVNPPPDTLLSLTWNTPSPPSPKFLKFPFDEAIRALSPALSPPSLSLIALSSVILILSEFHLHVLQIIGLTYDIVIQNCHFQLTDGIFFFIGICPSKSSILSLLFFFLLFFLEFPF